jgi:hypothetical protein
MTRVLVALALAISLAACSGDSGGSGCDYKGRHFDVGDQFTDACNDCTCKTGGVTCSLVVCGEQIDANPSSCEPSTGCDGFGPLCNGTCCNAGEKCVNDACMCGDHAGCGDKDRCSGPAMQNACGSVCCGGSGPCPL